MGRCPFLDYIFLSFFSLNFYYTQTLTDKNFSVQAQSRPRSNHQIYITFCFTIIAHTTIYHLGKWSCIICEQIDITNFSCTVSAARCSSFLSETFCPSNPRKYVLGAGRERGGGVWLVGWSGDLGLVVALPPNYYLAGSTQTIVSQRAPTHSYFSSSSSSLFFRWSLSLRLNCSHWWLWCQNGTLAHQKRITGSQFDVVINNNKWPCGGAPPVSICFREVCVCVCARAQVMGVSA